MNTQAKITELQTIIAAMSQANAEITALRETTPIPYAQIQPLLAKSNELQKKFESLQASIEKDAKNAEKKSATNAVIPDDVFDRICSAIEEAGCTIVEFGNSEQFKEIMASSRKSRTSGTDLKLKYAMALKLTRQGWPQSVAASKVGVTPQQLTKHDINTVPTTFRNPADRSVTWTSGGKGQMPRWFNEYCSVEGHIPNDIADRNELISKAE
jgi:H-NS histone family